MYHRRLAVNLCSNILFKHQTLKNLPVYFKQSRIRYMHNCVTMTGQPAPIKQAAILIIGDEVLNGKIKDTNSQYFADFCFKNGIELRRIGVVPDETEDIVAVLNEYRSRYDFIVTTGGIGPTHDDITYESVAKAFDLPLALNEETVDKMNAIAKHPPNAKSPESSELKAQLRMAIFPKGPTVVPNFVTDDLWVPVVSIDSQVYIFPGIPALFVKLLEGLKPLIESRIQSSKLCRHFISTTSVESVLAPLLSDIQERYRAQNIKVGSYPHYHDERNTISILGPVENEPAIKEMIKELIEQVDHGKEISAEEEALST